MVQLLESTVNLNGWQMVERDALWNAACHRLLVVACVLSVLSKCWQMLGVRKVQANIGKTQNAFFCAYQHDWKVKKLSISNFNPKAMPNTNSKQLLWWSNRRTIPHVLNGKWKHGESWRTNIRETTHKHAAKETTNNNALIYANHISPTRKTRSSNMFQCFTPPPTPYASQQLYLRRREGSLDSTP